MSHPYRNSNLPIQGNPFTAMRVYNSFPSPILPKYMEGEHIEETLSHIIIRTHREIIRINKITRISETYSNDAFHPILCYQMKGRRHIKSMM